jgi:hypothetical protein
LIEIKDFDMKNLLFVLILFLACSCNSNTRESNSVSGNDKFFEIKYENILANTKIVPLSQVASNIEYIKLETNDECMIRKINSCFFTDSLIFIANRDHILKFSRDGKFLQKIGKPGRGPGEIDLIRTMTLLPDKRMIAVQKNAIKEMLFFSFDGTVVKAVNIPEALYIKVINDGRFIVYDPGTDGASKNTFSLINETGDTISGIGNYCSWINTSGMAFMEGSYPEPFLYKNKWYFKDRYNDTVYTVVSDRIIPSYSVNMGKYKLPDELRLERIGTDQIQLYINKAPNYSYAILFEAADKLFIVSESYHVLKRKYLLFDKKEGIGSLLDNGNDVSKGFVNDMDGGMDFWPLGIVNDNQVYMPLDIVTLKKELEKINTGEKTVKYRDKQKEFEKMINTSDILDNPILMIATLKK